MSRTPSLEEFIAATNQAKTYAALCDCFRIFLRNYGIEDFLIHRVSQEDDISSRDTEASILTFPLEGSLTDTSQKTSDFAVLEGARYFSIFFHRPLGEVISAEFSASRSGSAFDKNTFHILYAASNQFLIIQSRLQGREAHLYGDVLPEMHRLRYRGFKERQNYDVPHYKGMEFDAYDTPATTYLIWRGEDRVVRGCARLFPTTLPYMIEEVWPHALSQGKLPKTASIWEASRMCIDKTLPQEKRREIHGEILCALQEVGRLKQIDWMIGVMQPAIWRSVFERAGWPIEFLSPVTEIGNKEKIVIGRMNLNDHILKSIREKFRIRASVLEEISCDIGYQRAA